MGASRTDDFGQKIKEGLDSHAFTTHRNPQLANKKVAHSFEIFVSESFRLQHLCIYDNEAIEWTIYLKISGLLS